MAEEALRRLGIQKEAAVHIGDSEIDIQTAEDGFSSATTIIVEFENTYQTYEVIRLRLYHIKTRMAQPLPTVRLSQKTQG